MKTTKRILSLALAGIMSLSMLVPAFAASATFTDVPSSHWAYNFVEKAAAEGFVTGVGNNRYNPSGNVTYAEFCTMLVRAFAPENIDAYESWCEFSGNSAGDTWYEVYLWSAQYGGMLLDTKAFSSPLGDFSDEVATSPINRYEMSLMMANLLMTGRLDRDYPSDSEISAAKSAIADWSSVPAAYQDAVAVCYAAGFLGGVDSKGTFAGTSNMDRAQAATVLCRLANLDVNGSNSGNESSNNQGNGTGTVTGSKDANGYTTAASVNGVKNRNKSDAYPTKGNSDTVSNNGYYTGATDAKLGDSVLVYDLLDKVNEARREAGLNPYTWVQSDAAEEYTLIRARDIAINFTHDRSDGIFATEVIAGAYSVDEVFNSWMNSEGHRRTILDEDRVYMCAAKNGVRWIITFWTDINVRTCELNSDDYIF